ncbi:helix-turn-helix domain-containing protein [Aurantiacibacter spongiae]|uniref:XRE family transcriptional regulator n=1 Tax=Aurantiacibacter spongiae TaxID=2488860 RepID=A0A3N5CYM5_9SPHN|nr:helix-turn-helix transcriptional regulator [Aurantiacibacter spongiae]RPF71789.1 XRE family transcriptional regulator [Aurantiacibacter spongiae]
MARKALYMGPRLKRVRRELGLTQANMAEDLEISASYIALMERNQRPVTADMLLKLATTYHVDIADLAQGESEQTAENLAAALRDPLFADIDLPGLDVGDIATSYPTFAEALLRLFAAYRQEHVALADLRAGGEGESPASQPDPVAQVRGFLAAHRNCFPDLDDSAARAARDMPDLAGMRDRIQERHGLAVRFEDDGLMAGAVRFHDYHRRRILINEGLPNAGRRFQVALQLAILEQGEAIDALVADAALTSEDARVLARRALQSYWAAAVLMPYAAVLKAAEGLRYDVELIAARFEVSFEQAAHRLTTLQRPGAKGIPFFFLRVDRAGNVSKRLDGAGFPFARSGGACPLWNIHHVFDRPRRVDAQVIALPDGERYLSIARTVSAGHGGYGAPRVTRAVALTCAAKHADRTIYADAPGNAEPTPIGVTCRLCQRPRCLARSAPPIGREIAPHRFRDTGVPFAFASE